MAISGFPISTGNASNVGDLSQLPTDDKTDIVSAIIEIDQDVQTWRNVKNIRAAVVTPSTGGINTTADHNWLVLTIPANTLKEGDRLTFDFYGRLQKSSPGSGFVMFWFKLGATKSTNLAVGYTSPTFPSRPFYFRGQLVVRAVGATNELVATATAHIDSFTHTIKPNLSTWAIDTTVDNTITIGCNLSVAAANNSTTVDLGGIELC